MYSSFHIPIAGIVGYTTMEIVDNLMNTLNHHHAIAIAIGTVIGFLSHHFVDRLAESGIFKSMMEGIIIDGIFIGGILLLIGYIGLGWEMALIASSGTYMDIWDKGLNYYYKYHGKTRTSNMQTFPCHNVPKTWYWAILSKKQTWILNIISWITFTIYVIIVSNYKG